MKVKWLGHSSFLITADDGTKIITDPYAVGEKYN
jgi:L-ascorbate metabolism protein UlaG (beta-lactamase superfamily)